MKLKAFLSSTFSDLQEYRQAVITAINSIQAIELFVMEYYSVSYTFSLERSITDIRGSDIFILLIGHRYGFVPQGQELSITHLEYLEALKMNIPIMVYVLSDKVPVTVSSVETDPTRSAQLSAFKNELATEHVISVMSSPDELKFLIVSDLFHIFQSRTDRNFHILPEKTPGDTTNVENYKKTIDDLKSKLRNIVPADPVWRGRNFQIDNLLCFALLPFQEQFFEVYESAISPSVEEIGMKALHAGEIFGNREIVEDIWDSICRARIVIVDVTGRNPNVFYELGICHTLGKESIIITQNRNDVPFDIRHRRFIEYNRDKLTVLRANLKRTIQAVLSGFPNDEK